MGDVIRHLAITGRVQGVGYRIWMSEQARSRGLAGWVRNRRDGSVEAVVSGSADSVDEMIMLSWRGPPSSNVAAIVVAEATPDEFALRGDEIMAMLPTI